MDDEELEAFRASLRGEAEKRIAPLIPELDRSQRFSPELWAVLRRMEIFGLPFAEEHGGSAANFATFAVAIEELARVGGVAGLFTGTTVQVATALLKHAEPTLVARWVPALVSGEVLAAWAFTEPATGSDPRQLRTRAEPDGSGWVVHGQKLFISYAEQAAIALVFARTPGGFVGAFLAETSDPGWSTGTPPQVLAFGGTEPRPVFLDGVRVAADHVVGSIDRGFEVLLEGEGAGKVRAAAICVGVAQRALDEAATYACSRTHRGEPIGRKFAGIRTHLANMQANVLAARTLVHSAADLIDRERPHAMEAAAARLVTSRIAREVTGAAMQVCGAYGLTAELPVERLYREGKFFEVAQGSSEIQQAIVANHVLDQYN